MNSSDNKATVVIAMDHGSITGGQAKVALDSALGLKRAGYRPIVFAAAAPVDPRLALEGVETVCLDQADLLGNASKASAAVQGIWNFRAEAELEKLLAPLAKDRTIVHVHGWPKALSPSIARPIRRSGLPAVYTMHEYFMFCPNGGFYDYQQNHVCKLEPMSAACWMTNCDSRSYPHKIWRGARQVVMSEVARLPQCFDDFILISAFQRGIVERRLPPGGEDPRRRQPHRLRKPGRQSQSGVRRFPVRRPPLARKRPVRARRGRAQGRRRRDLRRRRAGGGGTRGAYPGSEAAWAGNPRPKSKA